MHKKQRVDEYNINSATKMKRKQQKQYKKARHNKSPK
jgi:hypothetical protein